MLSLRGEEANALHKLADSIREKHMGKDVHLRGIIEFTNYCKQNCHYCGLRKSNTRIERYRLSIGQILATVDEAVKHNYKTVVLQGGEDNFYDDSDIAFVVREIRQKYNIAVTLSFGERSLESYKLWKAAGADRYLMKHETADPELYKQLRPGKILEERLRHQHGLKELGFQLGSGCMVGLPGQTMEMLAEDLLLLQKMDVDMAGIGPFIPHPETPLAGNQGGTIETTLNAVATARILMPDVHLPATTALGSISASGREQALQSGANVVMPNVTPKHLRALYQIYPNKICLNDEAGKCSQCIRGKIYALGRTVSNGPGHSYKKINYYENTGN